MLAAGLCAADASAAALDALLKDSISLQGWKLEGAPYHYSPANLYTYINGAADFFIAYGFCELVGAAYGSAAGDGSLITIDIYDMGEKLNAFGVFQSRRDPAAPAADIGAAALVSGDYLVFFKDRHYVEVQGVIKSQAQRPLLQAAGRSIADRLPGDARMPEQLAFFPRAALIAGSERYVRGGILGHAYWDRGLLGDYQLGDARCTAFVVLLGSEEEARASLERHRSFLQGAGKQCRAVDGIGGRGFESDEPHHKKILVAQAGRYVAGIYDLPSLQQGRHLLENLLGTIRSTKTP
jgi:hypothetical protein